MKTIHATSSFTASHPAAPMDDAPSTLIAPTGSRRGWPATLVTIAEIIGDEAALRLVAVLGGTRIRIPSRPRRESYLSAAIGHHAACLMGKALAGLDLDIPSETGFRSKKMAILAALAAGATTRDIARQHRVTIRYVRRIRAECHQDQ